MTPVQKFISKILKIHLPWVIKEVFLTLLESLESPIDKILNAKEPVTASKDKNEWVLITDGPQKEPAKMKEAPKVPELSLNLNITDMVPGPGQNQTPRTDRLSHVDEECAQDFVKTAFHDASEKDVAALKSDR